MKRKNSELASRPSIFNLGNGQSVFEERKERIKEIKQEKLCESIKQENKRKEKIEKQNKLMRKLSVMLYNQYTIEQLCNIKESYDFHQIELKHPEITIRTLLTAVDNAIEMHMQAKAKEHGEFAEDYTVKSFTYL